MPSLPPIRPEDEAVALKTRPTGAFDAPVDEAHGRTLFELALRLGDDSLILSQRLSEWCGHAPSVEVDLSLANMALDLIGQATHFLTLAAEAEGKGRSADDLAFRRDVLDMRNCLLVEQPNGDFAQTMARQFCFPPGSGDCSTNLPLRPRTALPRSRPRLSRKSLIMRNWRPSG
jgi:ring-1,2-phenylacetyl-CoA epoxidase subunit PaaC